MRFRFILADVFTDRIFGGNPLAVFPHAAGLDARVMQRLAAEIGFSETVFVFPSEKPTLQGSFNRRLRIFTPGIELPFAGHPTVGAAYVLAATGEVPLVSETTPLVFEEGVGPVEVTIHSEDGRPVFARFSAAQTPVYDQPPFSSAEIAALLSLEAEDLLLGDYPPQAVSCGVPFLFVPLRGLEAVGRAQLVQDLWERTLASYWAPHVYVITLETSTPQAQIHARMFAPAMGIREDPATGAAATALAGYLGVRQGPEEGLVAWTIEQGFEMGRPSFIEVEAGRSGGRVTAIRVGGRSVITGEGSFDLPDAVLFGD